MQDFKISQFPELFFLSWIFIAFHISCSQDASLQKKRESGQALSQKAAEAAKESTFAQSPSDSLEQETLPEDVAGEALEEASKSLLKERKLKLFIIL